MSKLLWVDMEMTGLDVNREVILEVAAIVTDLHFNELETFDAILKQPQHYLENMDEWNTRVHGASGWIAKVPFGMDPVVAEDCLVALVMRHFPDANEKPVLAGNSIAQDRLFIDRHMPRLSALLHYRMLDVTSWKLIMFNRFGVKTQKENKHRALDDIRESIKELQTYLQYVKIPN
ncbi:MAG: oligoribonuclease [Bdellovibrionaceae bacterium]|nr:oligoribonuclease [Pseudobdellovibrionaceae bacterium]